MLLIYLYPFFLSTLYYFMSKFWSEDLVEQRPGPKKLTPNKKGRHCDTIIVASTQTMILNNDIFKLAKVIKVANLEYISRTHRHSRYSIYS